MPLLELERQSIPPSPIQQMKDIAGMPDMPNAEFVAWFKRIFCLLENLFITGKDADGAPQPSAPVVTGDDTPCPAA